MRYFEVTRHSKEYSADEQGLLDMIQNHYKGAKDIERITEGDKVHYDVNRAENPAWS